MGHPVPPIVVRRQDRICALCSDDVPLNGTRPHQAIVQLDCGHFFCFLCIHRWSQIRHKQQLECPRCSARVGKVVFPEFHGARCLSDDPRFAFRYACARAKHYHDLGLPNAVTWDGARIIPLGHAELYVATFVYVVLIKTGDAANILDTGTKWQLLHALFFKIAQITKPQTMDSLHKFLWYRAHMMYDFPPCVCAKEGRPSDPRCFLSGEELGLKAWPYMKEVVRRSIMLALVTSEHVASSPVEADYVQPPLDSPIAAGRQAGDGDQVALITQAPCVNQPLGGDPDSDGSQTPTGDQSQLANQPSSGSPVPQVSQASNGNQAPSSLQASSVGQASHDTRAPTGRQIPASRLRTFLGRFR